MVPQKNKPQSFLGKLLGNLIAKQIVKPYNKIRKVYGLKKVKYSDEILSHNLNLIPISKYVLARNQYWEDYNVMTGYWFEDDKEYVPSKELELFLNSGEKPIILALGAMSFEDKPEVKKLSMFVNAFEKAGVRAIIQGFKKSLKDFILPSSMMALGSCPHSFLFKHGFCVVHHCGFGTTASTLSNGIPSIPVPHVLDQMGFAMQLYDLGVSSKPIESKDLSVETIYEAIIDMKNNYQERCNKVSELSKQILSEGGVNEAANLICNVLSR
jgi:UDP:flavonoid glycosyltransferase YjiC (YdhE family)